MVLPPQALCDELGRARASLQCGEGCNTLRPQPLLQRLEFSIVIGHKAFSPHTAGGRFRIASVQAWTCRFKGSTSGSNLKRFLLYNFRSSANPRAEPDLCVRRIIGSRQRHLCRVWTPNELPDPARAIQIVTKLNFREAQDVLGIRLVAVEGHHFHVGLGSLVQSRDTGLCDHRVIQNARIVRSGRGALEPGGSYDETRNSDSNTTLLWTLHPSLPSANASQIQVNNMLAAHPKH